jgi:hypothetical protein
MMEHTRKDEKMITVQTRGYYASNSLKMISNGLGYTVVIFLSLLLRHNAVSPVRRAHSRELGT